MLSFPFLRLQPVGEVSLFCLLHISSKLFLLTYNSNSSELRVFGEVTSSNTSREDTTRKLIMVDAPPRPIQALGLGKIPSHLLPPC